MSGRYFLPLSSPRRARPWPALPDSRFAQADAQAARESDQEAQKRAARTEDARRAFESESRKELDHLQKALAQTEAKLVSANEKVGQLSEAIQCTETESTRLGQERDQLQSMLTTTVSFSHTQDFIFSTVKP